MHCCLDWFCKALNQRQWLRCNLPPSLLHILGFGIFCSYCDSVTRNRFLWIATKDKNIFTHYKPCPWIHNFNTIMNKPIIQLTLFTQIIDTTHWLDKIWTLIKSLLTLHKVKRKHIILQKTIECVEKYCGLTNEADRQRTIHQKLCMLTPHMATTVSIFCRLYWKICAFRIYINTKWT